MLKNIEFKFLLLLLISVLLFGSLISFPYVGNLSNHDNGSQSAYDYWTYNGFLYGKDILQNVGPLAFINFPNIFTGFFFEIKLLTHMSLMAVLTSLLVLRIKQFPKLVSLLLLFIFFLYLNGDSVYYILVSLIFMYLCDGKSNLSKHFLVVILALISLSKSMFLLLSVLIIFFYVLINIRNQNLKKVIIVPLTLIIRFSFLWLLSNQTFSNLIDFISGFFTFSKGYNGAMAIYESLPISITGFSVFILTLLIFLSMFLLSLISSIEKKHKWLFFLFIIFQGGLFLISWKHGFVRADEHVNVFFIFVMINNFLILSFTNSFFLQYNNRLRNVIFRVLIIKIVCVTLLSLTSITVVKRLSPFEIFENKIKHFNKTVEFYWNFSANYKKLNISLKNEIKSISLPDIKKTIGDSTVSYMGMLPGYAIFNNFNYKVSPTTISFGTFNKYLMNKEADFYSTNNTLPDFILYDLQTIDDRLLPLDNSLAKLEILKKYNIKGFEKGLMLLS